MFLSVSQYEEPMTRLRRLNVNLTLESHVIDSRSRSELKVMGFILESCVCSISHELAERFSLSFTQMFLSVSWCAEPMTQLCKLKVNVILQGHEIKLSSV